MQISMPVAKPDTLQYASSCTPHLARNKDSDEQMTVMLFDDTVAYFEKDNKISHSDLAYFERKYVIIRRYNPGEALVITM
jgi:hypothetical protein